MGGGYGAASAPQSLSLMPGSPLNTLTDTCACMYASINNEGCSSKSMSEVSKYEESPYTKLQAELARCWYCLILQWPK